MHVSPSDQVFLVTADHVSPAYAADRLPVRVSIYRGAETLYYASVHPYGCGKNSRTPEGAIQSLFAENGCRNIRVEPGQVFVAIDPEFGEIGRNTDREELATEVARLGYVNATISELGAEADAIEPLTDQERDAVAVISATNGHPAPTSDENAMNVESASELKTCRHCDESNVPDVETYLQWQCPCCSNWNDKPQMINGKVVKWRGFARFGQIQFEDGTGELTDVVTREPEGLRITGNGSLQAPLTVEVADGSHVFTEAQRHAIANALEAAAIRWTDFAATMAGQGVSGEMSETFRTQAEEARAFASLFMNGPVAPIRPEPMRLEDQFRALLAAGLARGTARNIMAEADQENYPAYIATAREQWASNELEIDDAPEVSPGGDSGVWVAAWVRVSDDDAGVPHEGEASDDDNEDDPHPGHALTCAVFDGGRCDCGATL